MKPITFIGSSVEGLKIAYAIQQNLNYDTESRVWDQGVFGLSKTTIESLEEQIDKSDFAIFVFSDDDVVKMRGEDRNTIRDNVLFEFGLWAGRLGRERVYFVTPQGSDLHLPTDMLGITGGTYETNRQDNSMQSATGYFCTQVRDSIISLGCLRQRDPVEKQQDAPEDKIKTKEDHFKWLELMHDKKYDDASECLKIHIETLTGDDKTFYQVWLEYIEFKRGEGINKLLTFVENNKEIDKVYLLAARLMRKEQYYNHATPILKELLLRINRTSDVYVDAQILLAICLKESTGLDEATSYLESIEDYNDIPEIALLLADFLEDEEASLEVLINAYNVSPNNREIMYDLAGKAADLGHRKIALFLYDNLATESKDSLHLGYLSNICLDLNLYDRAMFYCREAIKVSDNKAWLLGNIGNMMNNKGLYCDAIDWFSQSLDIEKDSQYVHDRFSKAMKNKSEQIQKYHEIINEGRLELRNFQFN